MNKKTMNEKILDYIYVVSKQPVLYRDLLQANALHNEGMYVDPGKLNFRMNIANAYIVYAIICGIVLIPIFAITHTVFADLDFHISLIGTIAATSFVFIGFNFFRAYMRDKITKKLIQKAWTLHFPYFPYEKYSEKVEIIYNEAIKKEIHRKDLEKYVLDRLIDIPTTSTTKED